MLYQVKSLNRNISGKIKLPASKSISNRVLIISALGYNPYPIINLSDSDDTKILAEVLTSNTNRFDIGHAGTAMRFLTAYLSKIVGEWEITGSPRMKQRPIGILVEALCHLGARIEYIEKEGFPPLRIFGSHLKGGVLEIDGSVSSQYITALLLIAPTLENGLILRLKNKVTSSSYIILTLKLMAYFGIAYKWINNEIHIPEQTYLHKDFTVEADWSGASYWYLIAALADKADIELENLYLNSLQGDSAIAGWFSGFGVETSKTEKGIRLIKAQLKMPEKLDLDFKENPDVAQTMAVLCVAKKVPFHFKGLETLKIKETDRISALQTELQKLGALLTEPQKGELSWDGFINPESVQPDPVISTYHDHRMALSFAPMALTGNSIKIDDPMVITKSYPGFWSDLENTGFDISEI
ncbi:MAG: 3-phosphoshikimate 1-carboxyvinyltransferase [Prolixibacteraceae bacterium]|nr:3-phosphoshikimate 1-carboxyvinyltransferase [Prolixibacteraceae bacterium]MBN2772715.1 3-phosphoshikimate 1-carboxyvinyltransferase [Prolixibacteraceae bacterium]